MDILAVIPARSGSKGVRNKNIKLINGKPLLAYSIEHAKESPLINRIIVSTDSQEYGEIAKRYGAEVPFIRPSSISLDDSLDIEVFQHALGYLKEKESYVPDLVVQLRPTYPIRNSGDIDNMIELLIEDPLVDSVRGIVPVKETPYKMWRMNSEGILEPILSDIYEAYNEPRQKLPQVYSQNACIDVIRTETIVNHNSMTGSKVKGYLMKENFDIDTKEDFLKASQYIKLIAGSNRFVIDIDGVVASFVDSLDYVQAKPNRKMIDVINKLYDSGNYIVLFTARGYVTKLDWLELTKSQMDNWGLKYHELHMGKPNADFYIDDKMLEVEELYKYFE
ncbi:cytidylyltransferase domain-containing protein [Sporosarcina sp. PTS2304]|uniref:acylneuraminate cytidylyltransferase family protein n=1 Tax=Sporosarcina sp. PTS2304 TaxID=2283194 RepID=UPI0013B3E915|nr:acylneuraminate cytidylyltransferase family protein [Sporosarcina sp. PTS2304]